MGDATVHRSRRGRRQIVAIHIDDDRILGQKQQTVGGQREMK